MAFLSALTGRLLRRLWVALVSMTLVCISWSGGAWAQDTPQDTLVGKLPVYSSVDANGVDLVTGAFTLSTTDVTIGQPGVGGLTYERRFTGTGWRDSLQGGIDEERLDYTVSIGGVSEKFTQQGAGSSTFINDQGGGSTLTYDSNSKIYTYTLTDGTVVKFSYNYWCIIGDNTGKVLSDFNQGRITSLTFPTGEIRTWTYKLLTMCLANGKSCVNYGRLQSVTNNLGYQLKLSYAVDGTHPMSAKRHLG